MGYEVYFNKTVKEKRHTLSVLASWGTQPSKIYTVLIFTREEQITLLDWHCVREFHQWAEPWVVLELRKIRLGNFQRTAWEKCGGLARPTQPNLSPNVWFLWELEYLASARAGVLGPASKSCCPVTLPLVLCCPQGDLRDGEETSAAEGCRQLHNRQSRGHTRISYLERRNKFYRFLSWCTAVLIFSFHIFPPEKGEGAWPPE